MIRISRVPQHLVAVLEARSYRQVMVYRRGVYYQTGSNYIYFSNSPRLNALSVALGREDLIFLQQARKRAAFSFFVDEETQLVDLAWQGQDPSQDLVQAILRSIEALNPPTGLQMQERSLLENYEFLQDFLVQRPWGDLLGRGLGLTPSGDDVLAGYLAGARYRGLDRPGRADLDLGRTNDISGQFLAYALEGIFSEDLLALFAGGRTGEVIERMLKTGHTSGADTLLGVYYALNQ